MTPMEQFDRVCRDYQAWYLDGRWTFERFTQAIEDAASILFPKSAPEREAVLSNIGTAV